MPPTPPIGRSRLGRALVALLGAAALLLGPLPATPASAAAKGSLTLEPGRAAWATVGGKRTSAIASVAVVVPAALPASVGLQLRASGHDNGYRARLSIAADGALTGALARVAGGAETSLGTPTALGLRTAAGAKLRLEAAVVGANPVKVYLRAWRDGTVRPPHWQLVASDASSRRRTAAGRAYLWAQSDAAGTLAFSEAKASGYSVAAAKAAGVVVPEPDADTFSIAVIGDTQGETAEPGNARMLNRANWLVANRSALDLRYVLHTGDMTNWGWLDAAQYTRAKQGIAVLGKAGIPYSLTIGNHDTQAVGWDGVHGSSGYGGSGYAANPECPKRLGAAECKSWLLLRNTDEFNAAFPLATMGGVGGAYEAGRVDNNWTSFSANDTTWLVLTLELWPRKQVVEWARQVVASHPDANVIIQTHCYLNSKGRISTSDGGYGATSPRYLYDKLVSKYRNVKLVVSGHTGKYTSRTDSRGGNPVLSFLGNSLKNDSNPVRVLRINTRTGQVATAAYDPLKTRAFDVTVGRISVVR